MNKSSIIIKEGSRTFYFSKFWDGAPGDIALGLSNVDYDHPTGLQIFKEIGCNIAPPEAFCEYFYEFNVEKAEVSVFGYETFVINGYSTNRKDLTKKIFSGSIKDFVSKFSGLS